MTRNIFAGQPNPKFKGRKDETPISFILFNESLLQYSERERLANCADIYHQSSFLIWSACKMSVCVCGICTFFNSERENPFSDLVEGQSSIRWWWDWGNKKKRPKTLKHTSNTSKWRERERKRKKEEKNEGCLQWLIDVQLTNDDFLSWPKKKRRNPSLLSIIFYHLDFLGFKRERVKAHCSPTTSPSNLNRSIDSPFPHRLIDDYQSKWSESRPQKDKKHR